MIKRFLLSHLKTLRAIRVVLAILLGIMIVIDIVLVSLDKDGYPTFSEVVQQHRNELVWLNFLLAGLISKVFYNRRVYTKKREISGFLAFLTIIALLFILGRLEQFEVTGWHQLAVMICGAVVGQRIWPQYVNFEEPKTQ